MFRIRLSELCFQQGVTMRALAAMLEVDYQTVMYWNQGRAYPRLPMIVRLADYFNCSLDELITEKIQPME
jgi:transcriptional regulator with XRE-family HTH domain